MADRREALDSVVNQIDSKVGDLDQRLKRFSALLQETFEAAEGRARDIARVLAEASTEGTKAIANQYELVRATSDEERKRTSEALQLDLRAGDRRDLRAVPPDQRALHRDRAPDEAR